MTKNPWREVRPRSAQRPDGRWAPQALVFHGESGAPTEQELFGPEGVTFDTREEADRYAVMMGNSWIDRR